MSFSEICVYQVKPDKVEEFETIMNEASRSWKSEQGSCRCVS